MLDEKVNKTIKPLKHKIRTTLGYITINLLIAATTFAVTSPFAIMMHPKFDTGYSISKSLSYAEKFFLNKISHEEDYSKLNIYLSKENIPLDKMLEAARGNSKLNTHELEYIEKFIVEVYETYPKLDKRLFYESLSKLDIGYMKLAINKIHGETETLGQANFNFQEIIIDSEFSDFSVSENYEILGHELTHFLLGGTLYHKNVGYYRNYRNRSEDIGIAVVEGLTCYMNEKITKVEFSNGAYESMYKAVKRLIAIIGEEELINIVQQGVYNLLESILAEKSGMPEKSNLMVTQMDVMNKYIPSGIELNNEDYINYMEAEIDLFFSVHKKKLDNNFQLAHYFYNRDLFIKNVGQSKEVIKLFWKKEKTFLEPYYEQITNFNHQSLHNIDYHYFNQSEVNNNFNFENMSVIISKPFNNQNISISNHAEYLGNQRIEIYLVESESIDGNTLINGAIDYNTNYIIDERIEVMDKISLSGFLEFNSPQNFNMLQNSNGTVRYINLNNVLNFEALINYLDEVINKDYQYDQFRGLPQRPSK